MSKKEQAPDNMGGLDSGQALGEIARTMGHALEVVLAREKALSGGEGPAHAETFAPVLGGFPARLAELEDLARKTAKNLQEVDAGLEREENYLREKLAALDDMRRRLADWGGRAIG